MKKKISKAIQADLESLESINEDSQNESNTFTNIESYIRTVTNEELKDEFLKVDGIETF